MPELPEVENVTLSLKRLGFADQVISHVELLRANLRTAFPPRLNANLAGQHIRAIQRRAKFILFETDDYFLLSHLGMTGSWRSDSSEVQQKHDHVILKFVSGARLVYNDPRRFGLLDLIAKHEVASNIWLKHLGLEPLSDQFDGEFLYSSSRKLKVAIKGFIMDQKRVVGVGNIYASEALFRSGIRPTRPAGKLRLGEATELAAQIKAILYAAILAGGSTIRDYKNSEGKDGRFQAQFQVYGRAKQPCPKCKAKILAKRVAGRNSFWCAKCQS